MQASGEESPLRFGLQCLALVFPLALTANGWRSAFSEISSPLVLSHFGMKAFGGLQLIENMDATLELFSNRWHSHSACLQMKRAILGS